jgi:hypothetical protein
MIMNIQITELSETRIQQDIVMYFKNKYCLLHHKPRRIIFSVPNERSNTREQMRMIATGLLTGVSDLIIITEHGITFIECKTVKGKQSESQKMFQKNVEELGYSYYLVRSLEDFKLIEHKIILTHAT